MPDPPIDPWEVIRELLENAHRMGYEGAIDDCAALVDEVVTYPNNCDCGVREALAALTSLRDTYIRRPSIEDCSDPWECCVHSPEMAERALSTEEPSEECPSCGSKTRILSGPPMGTVIVGRCTDPWHREPSE